MKVVQVLLSSAIDLLLAVMSYYEQYKDPDGLPINIEEYEEVGHYVAQLRDFCSKVANQNKYRDVL